MAFRSKAILNTTELLGRGPYLGLVDAVDEGVDEYGALSIYFEDTAVGFRAFSDFSIDAYYGRGDVVKYTDGHLYESLEAGNYGNLPTNTAHWKKVKSTYPDYVANKKYVEGDFVCHPTIGIDDDPTTSITYKCIKDCKGIEPGVEVEGKDWTDYWELKTGVHYREIAYNFEGVRWHFRRGLTYEEIVADPTEVSLLPNSESEVSVSAKVTHDQPITRTIESGEVDDLRIRLYFPNLYYIDDDSGDMLSTKILFKFSVRPFGDSEYNDIPVEEDGDVEIEMKNKAISPFEYSYLFEKWGYEEHPWSQPTNWSTENPGIQFTGPWDFKVTRISQDYESEKRQGEIHWQSYTKILREHMALPDVACIDIRLDSQDFGNQVPNMGFRVYGLCDLYIPSNYSPNRIARREGVTDDSINYYSGTWDGTFTQGWTNNPAWILYNILVHPKWGLGEGALRTIGITEDNINKYDFYELGQRCDDWVDSGKKNESGQVLYEPRFTFNYTLNTQEDVYQALKSIASAFTAVDFWSAGKVQVNMDLEADTSFLATPSNVVDGWFSYQGTSRQGRHSVAIVTWNDPEDSYKASLATYEDHDLIALYGWVPLDIMAVGCTSYGQALRLGKHAIETEKNETETVTFKGSWMFVDCVPGSIIEVADPYYENVRFGGRVAYVESEYDNTATYEIGDRCTYEELLYECIVAIEEAEEWNSDHWNELTVADSITLDSPVTLEEGKSYDITVTVAEAEDAADRPTVAKLVMSGILDAPGEYTKLTLSGLTPIPQPNSIWMVTDTVVPHRKFRVISNKEVEPHIYEISALLHDETKYDRIYGSLDLPPSSNVQPKPIGLLPPPMDFGYNAYAYPEGNNYALGLNLSWIRPNDNRIIAYQIEMTDTGDEDWDLIGTTSATSYDQRPIKAGTYDFRIRSIGTTYSTWAYLFEVTIGDPSENVPDVENLHTKEGGSKFNGPDCELLWNTVIDELYMPKSRFLDYKVQIYAASTDVKARLFADTQRTFESLEGRTWENLSSIVDPIRTDYVTDEKYRYTFRLNQDDFGENNPQRSFIVSVVAREVLNKKESTTPTLLTVTNDAPTMVYYTPVVTSTYDGISVNWEGFFAPTDVLRYKVMYGTTSDCLLEGPLVAGDTKHAFISITPLVATTYYVKVIPIDHFGEGVASQVEDTIIDPAEVLDGVIGQITESHLYQDLNERIDLIDTPSTGLWDRMSVTEGVLASQASTISGLSATVSGHTSAIATEQSVRASAVAPTFNASTYYTHGSNVAYNGYLYRRSASSGTDYSWIPSNWTQITTSLYAQYTIRLDVDGYVSGFGMSNDGAESQFIIKTDKFLVGSPGKTSIQPFVLDTTVTPSVIGFNGLLIARNTISNDSITSIDGGKITTGSIGIPVKSGVSSLTSPPSSSGLYMYSDKFGFYNQTYGNWPINFMSDGKWYLGNPDATKYMYYDGAEVYFVGIPINISSISDGAITTAKLSTDAVVQKQSATASTYTMINQNQNYVIASNQITIPSGESYTIISFGKVGNSCNGFIMSMNKGGGTLTDFSRGVSGTTVVCQQSFVGSNETITHYLYGKCTTAGNQTIEDISLITLAFKR